MNTIKEEFVYFIKKENYFLDLLQISSKDWSFFFPKLLWLQKKIPITTLLKMSTNQNN